MNRKHYIGIAAIVILVGGWYLFRPELLFVNARVNESFPSANGDGMSDMKTVAQGMFHGVAHQTKGTATIHQNGKMRTLRLTDFETSNGPALHVYLVATSDASDNATVTNAGFKDLGALKGNIGDQNYEIPADVDLAKYQAVTIWCSRFNVNFATAPLMAGSTTMPAPLARGMFHGVAHETKGTATIHKLANGKQVLRLTDFSTSNGPALHLYLVAAKDASDNAAVTSAGFIDLGALKGNVGDQNYELPADVDLGKHQAVTVWCSRFNVNFATAPLMTVQ